MDQTLCWSQAVTHLIRHILNVTEDCQTIQAEPATFAVIWRLKLIPFRDALILCKSGKKYGLNHLNNKHFLRSGQAPTYPSGWIDRQIYDGNNCKP